MEFWPENQGQSSLYSKFGTVPGRNCTHNYHDRHQTTHYPLYYGEQQDQGRESNYWTLPGSRTGGAPQEYTNWTDQELTAPTPSHFPFILDRHVQQHQDLGEYQPHEAREWTAAQRAAREYERGFLREAWQRRWEPCSPVRYNREVSTKRSDSSYRELEAWAARYSHSLPRRRRIEAELRGASQGLLESSRAPERDSRSGTDPRVAALQQVLQSANIRESGLWDRGGRQQAPTYYPSQTPAMDTSHTLDMKEKTSYQRRIFSQPPGYIAPPPYNSPHKSSPVLHHCDTSWEQEGKRQAYWSQPTLGKQDVSVDLQDHRKGEKVDFTKPDGIQKTIPELEGLKHRRQETDDLQASSPISIQKTHIQSEGMLSLQQPQVLQAIQNKMINEEPSSKVIEGRKFRLNKKTGGLTIFCLVSRIAGTTETPSLPLCTSQTNIQNTELGGVSEGLRDSSDINQTHKLADEVDFRAPTLTEQSNTSDALNLKPQQKETPTCVESEKLEDNLSDKAETDASPGKANTNDTDSTFGRQVAQSVLPVSVKYPLWREPSFTSRAETESSSTSLGANSEEGESDHLHSEASAEVHPIDIEVRRLDIKKDTESDDSTGLLVIDTTCVVVKMELIQSPKKEHVHYFGSTAQTECSPLDTQSAVSPEFVQFNSQPNQDVTTDQDSDLTEKKVSRGESEISFPCMSSSSVSERETLEERAERILGIPLHDCITEQQPEAATSLLDLCVEDLEVEPSPIKDNNIDDVAEQIPKDTTEEEQSQSLLEVGQTEDTVCSQDNDDAKDQVVNEGGEDFAGPQEHVSNMSEDSQLETDIKASLEIEAQNLLDVGQTEEAVCSQDNDDAKDQVVNEGGEDFAGPQEHVSNMSEDSQLETDIKASLEIEAQNLLDVGQTEEAVCSQDNDDAKDQVVNEGGEDFAGPQEHVSNMSEDSQLETDIKASLEIEMSGGPLLKSTSEEGTTEQSQEENQPVGNDTSSQHPSQYLSPTTNLSNSSSPSPSLDCEAPNPALSLILSSSNLTSLLYISESNIEEGPDPELTALNSTENPAPYPETSSLPHTPSQQLPSPLPPGSTDFSPSSTPHTDHSSSPSPLNLIVQTAEAMSGTEDQDEKGETLQLINSEISDALTEKLASQQQFVSGQQDNAACVKESNVTDEQQSKEADKDHTDPILEQTLQICQENAIEVNILQQQLECVQAEDVTCVKESYMTEEQSQNETNEDHTDHIMEQSLQICQENAIEVNILQQQLECVQAEDVTCVKESYMTEEQSQKEANEDPTSKENVTDSQTQIEIETLQDIGPQIEPSNSSPPTPSDSDCETSQSSLDVLSPSELPSPPHALYKSDTEFVSLLKMDSDCPSALNPDAVAAAGIPETVPPPLHLNSCEESLQFSSSSFSYSPRVLLPGSSTPPLQQGSGSVSPDLPLKGEPQYPKSLWDAVNRIRKHTAPDSENEEEEVSELWDPESAGEDLGFPDVVVDMNSEKIVFDEAGQQEVSTAGSVEDVEVGQIQQYPCHEELSGHAEEDTLSCSSASSHGSGDTVIVADEDDIEETPPGAETESKTENDKEFQTSEEERCCSGEVKDETAVKEEGDDRDESVTESSQSEECPVKVANTTTKAVKMTETEQKENEEEVFVPSEVSDEGVIESESVK